MVIKIERPHYANLRITEYIIVVLHLIKIAAKYNMEELHLTKSYGILVALKLQFEEMKVYVRRHEAVAKMDALDRERDMLLNACRGVVKAYRNVSIATKVHHVAALAKLLDDHRSETIADDNRTAETERIAMLYNAIMADYKLREAIEALAITDIAERLHAANNEFNELFMQYIANTSAEEKPNTVALRREGNKALTQFFNAIEYCAFEYEDVNYLPLANEVNSLNGYYITRLKARATRNKNRGKDNADIISDDDIITPPAE